MADSLSEYKRFIDGLVATRESLAAQRVREGVWHAQRQADPLKFSALLEALSPSEREVIAEIIQGAADTATRDVLVFLSNQGYRLTREGAPLAEEPFGQGMAADYGARRNGDPWPDEA